MQDTWKAARSLTLDYGLRFYHMPTEHNRNTDETLDAVFLPSRWDPAKAPRLYAPDPRNPALVVDPARPDQPLASNLANVLRYTIVPGSGDPLNGIVPLGKNGIGGSGIRDPKFLLLAPRGGFAWQPFGAERTVLRGGFGWAYNRNNITDTINRFENGLGRVADLAQTSFETMAAPSTVQPIAVKGFGARDEKNNNVPTVYDYSLSVQRHLFSDWVVDVAYVGNQQRHQPVSFNINAIPLGTAFAACCTVADRLEGMTVWHIPIVRAPGDQPVGAHLTRAGFRWSFPPRHAFSAFFMARSGLGDPPGITVVCTNAREADVAEGWERLLTRWTDAGLLDRDGAERIRAFEAAHARSSRLRWPIWLALVFGALTLAAGVLLFVSAHWDSLSPQVRFALVAALVAMFHVGGAMTADRFPAMASTLHAIGTAVLGAGIFLAGQIFNLDEHWPGGLMLWTLGAAAAAALLRSWPQIALVATLAPAWLNAEWFVATENRWSSSVFHVAACGSFLLALAYFTAVRPDHLDLRRRTLAWLGGIWLIPTTLALAFDSGAAFRVQPLPPGLRTVGWSVALAAPLIVAIVMRRAAAWPNLLAIGWALVLIQLRPDVYHVSLYAWWALGAVALAAWGVHEARTERINLGAAIFAATVLTFYFSHVMDKLERSVSLVGLGLLFLAGGWAIERVRRRLVLEARGGVA